MKALIPYIRKAKILGFARARIIDPATVVTGNWVRLKCQYGCSGYGACLTCPPYTPTPEYTQRTLSEYSRALLLQTREVDLNQELGSSTLLRRRVVGLERELFLDGYYKAFGLASGPCGLCRNCDTTTGCRHPEQARPSMEACGIDVYQTARNNGFKLEVVASEDCPCAFVGLVLVD